MNNGKKQSQFELFPGSSSSANQGSKEKPLIIKNLTVAPENIIVFSIIFIMTIVLSFSYGVERGRVVRAGSPDLQQVVENPEPMKIDTNEPVTLQVDPAVGKVITKEASSTVEDKNERVIDLKDIERELAESQYTIQVASFKLQKNAQKEAKNIADSGQEAFVLPKGSHSIVCVGKFAERGDAKQYSVKLRSKYKDFLIRRL